MEVIIVLVVVLALLQWAYSIFERWLKHKETMARMAAGKDAETANGRS